MRRSSIVLLVDIMVRMIDFTLSKEELSELFDAKYPFRENGGWGPLTREKFGYYSPDDHYEALVKKLVHEGSIWADIGCGRDIFPSNDSLAHDLAKRCRHIVGIDPDPNIQENPYISDRFQMSIEEFSTDEEFDIVTMRMVAEHIGDPESVVSILAQITRSKGYVVVYTPHKWAPVSIVARITPMAVHHWAKSRLWNTEEKDTFPVEYRMNTRSQLLNLFSAAGFVEKCFTLLDDCRIFNNYRVLNYLDLCLWKSCQTLRLPYPERCILAVYQKE